MTERGQYRYESACLGQLGFFFKVKSHAHVSNMIVTTFWDPETDFVYRCQRDYIQQIFEFLSMIKIGHRKNPFLRFFCWLRVPMTELDSHLGAESYKNGCKSNFGWLCIFWQKHKISSEITSAMLYHVMLDTHCYRYLSDRHFEFKNGRSWNLLTRVSQGLENIQM